MGFFIPPHTLTNFEIRNIIKMNQDLMVFFQEIIYLENKGGGICNNIGCIYFDSFGVEHIPKEIKKFIGNKNRKLTFFEYKQTIQ